MSRHPRDYVVADRYDDRDTDIYRRPRRDRDYDDFEVDITRQEYQERPRRAETVVKERDSVVGDRRDRGPRLPDVLREDYGKQPSAGELVIRDDRDDDVYSRAPTRRRRSIETVRSRAPTERVEKDEFVLKETERSERGPPYPRSGRSEVEFRGREDDEIVYRERTRSRPPPREREEEKVEINIRREESRPPPPRESPVEEIRFRRGGGDRPPPPRTNIEKTEIEIRETSAPPPRARTVVDREEIDIRGRRSPAPPRSVVDKEEIEIRDTRRGPRGREVFKEEIDIRERSAGPPRHRSVSRPNLVARKEEEWIVRRPRTPPPQDYEKEEIIIRRKEKSVSPEPEPPREPTPEPPPPPPPEPIYRPPIIQEVITHHRHIDHGIERVRSPTPPPPPPSPPKETKDESLEIEIKRKGTRNGKAYEEDIIFETDHKDREEPSRELQRWDDRRERSISVARRRSPSPYRRRYDDEMAEADYYNRKIASRAYPGEAWNGATKDWGLVDIPPGTERVRMDGIGGGAQEVSWDRYTGSRRGRFISGDRAYEPEYGNGYHSPPPLPIAPPAPRERREEKEEIKITHTRTNEEKSRKRDKMWTEVTKDLVTKEAIEEQGYSYEETDDHFYIIEYLKYEDVLRLVEITEDIKRERRDRIRELQWEREERERVPKMLPAPPVPASSRSKYDERIYEREYIYDRDGRRWR